MPGYLTENRQITSITAREVNVVQYMNAKIGLYILGGGQRLLFSCERKNDYTNITETKEEPRKENRAPRYLERSNVGDQANQLLQVNHLL